MLAPACIRPMSSARRVTSLQRRRHVAIGDALGEAFDHRGLADPRLAHQDRVVLAAAQQDVDQLADFGIAADDRVDLAAARLFGQVDGIFGQRLALAHGCAAASVRRRGGAGIGLGLVARSRADRLEFVGQPLGLDLAEFGLIMANSAFFSVGVLSMP